MTFRARSHPAPIWSALIAACLMLTGCASSGAQVVQNPDVPPLAGRIPSGGLALSAAEEAYVEQTAAVVYRRQTTDRMRSLLFSDERGHGICVRSPAGRVEDADYTLLVLQRRVAGDVISQVEDDVLILRSAADAAPCRAIGADTRSWIRAS